MHKTDKTFETVVPKLQGASTEHVDIKVKVRHPILDLSVIAEEVFALGHCLLARDDWSLPSADGRTV